MKRTRHRELRDLAHLWDCRHWHFQSAADWECDRQAQELADLAGSVRDAYEGAARFEISETEALAKAAHLARVYDRAFARLDAAIREHAEDIIPRTVPVFRELWRKNAR